MATRRTFPSLNNRKFFILKLIICHFFFMSNDLRFEDIPDVNNHEDKLATRKFYLHYLCVNLCDSVYRLSTWSFVIFCCYSYCIPCVPGSFHAVYNVYHAVNTFEIENLSVEKNLVFLWKNQIWQLKLVELTCPNA